MKIRIKLVFTALLLLTSLSANAQLIGEGDTLWYKSLYPNTISHVQFSPDGSKLGVVSYDGKYVGKFVMYDALTGEELWQFGLATHYFKQFSYSLDGQHIYVLPPSNLKISVLKVSNGDLVDTLPVTKGENVKFDYDQVFQTNNSNILLLSNYNGYFALYDVNQRKITKEKATNRVSRINASPYSDYFILAYQYESSNTWKTKINIYDINTLDNIATLGEEEGLVENGGEAKISYNGKYAATNFGGRALQIWDLENKKLFKEYPPTIPTDSTSGRGPQNSLAFTHSNDIIINCGGELFNYGQQGRSTTLTNFLNDKRALILDRMSGAISIDVDKTDRYIAFPRSPKSIVVYKLHLDAVPIDDKQNYLGNDIYPNPTTGTITVNIPYNFGRVITSALYDISGKLIMDFSQFDANVDKDKILFSLTGIQPGIYYLTITSKNNTLTYKVIYQR